MRLELTRIGNSRGIRIPKPLITQCGLGEVVELRVTPSGLIIAPSSRTPSRLETSFCRRASGGERDAPRSILTE